MRERWRGLTAGSRMNGFGCASRDTGHKRVPLPPERMRGISMTWFWAPGGESDRERLAALARRGKFLGGYYGTKGRGLAGFRSDPML